MDGASVAGFIALFLMIYAGYLNKLYNALFTFVLAMIAAVIACNFFEPLGNLWPENYKHYAYGVTFLLLFALTLFILEIIVTYLYPDNLSMPTLVNSLGGVLFGALTGVVLAGVLAISFYLLPLRNAHERKSFLHLDRHVASVLTLMNQKAGGHNLDAQKVLLQVSKPPPEKLKERLEERYGRY